MTPPPRSPTGAHDEAVSTYIERRLVGLRGTEPIGDKRANPSKAARQAILGFIESKRGEVGNLHLRNYLAWLPIAADRLGEQFLKPEPGIQARFNECFPTDHYSYHSRQTVGGILMGFWRHRLALTGREFPSHLHLKFGRWKSPFNGNDMLGRGDIAKIAQAADNFRDQALVWVAFESGCRPGEIYPLRIGDVVPKSGYIELAVRREKDSEHIPALLYGAAVPALLTWLKHHPNRDMPSAPLWVALKSGERGRAAGYRALHNGFCKAAKRAGFPHATLYHLRRSRLTELAKDGTISQSVLEKIAGWTTGSRVAKHYIHLNADDVRAALSKRYGAQVPEKPPAPAPSPVTCARCETVNEPGDNFCSTCGGPLTMAATTDLRELSAGQARLLKLLDNPEVVDFIARQAVKAGRA